MDPEYARVESVPLDRESYHQVDAQIIKTHYARDDNEKILTFCLQEDPNLALDLSSISINFSVEIPDDCSPDNGFCAKLFKSLNIEINSQLITNTKAL